MRPFIALLAGLVVLGGCAYRDHDGAYRDHDRVGVSVGHGNYYDGYYDGSYGAFHDGYWGDDGAFYYADGDRNWHRDDSSHFRRDGGNGSTWVQIHGSGAHRDH